MLGINPKGMGVSDESTKSEKVVTVVVPSGEERFEIRINKKIQKGKIIFHTTNEEESELMALLVCK